MTEPPLSGYTVGVTAEVQQRTGDTGVLEPAVGNPNQLQRQELPHTATISQGQLVVTAGFRNPEDTAQSGSLYPPGIPIGRVAAFSPNTLINSGQVPVTPLASVRGFTAVQILTKPYAGGSEEADVSGTTTVQSR